MHFEETIFYDEESKMEINNYSSHDQQKIKQTFDIEHDCEYSINEFEHLQRWKKKKKRKQFKLIDFLFKSERQITSNDKQSNNKNKLLLIIFLFLFIIFNGTFSDGKKIQFAPQDQDDELYKDFQKAYLIKKQENLQNTAPQREQEKLEFHNDKDHIPIQYPKKDILTPKNSYAQPIIGTPAPEQVLEYQGVAHKQKRSLLIYEQESNQLFEKNSQSIQKFFLKSNLKKSWTQTEFNLVKIFMGYLQTIFDPCSHLKE